ncbi:hypothetical protein EB796_018344 [Bugula neritina]|uniref:Uncharacterized protein n=1 Tax=Bugula neritina TaxID=10212 RepID=A0A7J7JAS8_BUGNE|nr:hypothetical protein EB796_018344 [Bugula neritina]
MSADPIDSLSQQAAKVETPEYICFINHSDSDKNEKSYKHNGVWKGRRKKAPPRVKSLYTESLIRVKGDFAPGYTCKWERLKHLPDIKPTRDLFERQPTAVDEDTMNMYKDIDANFSQNRVDEILKSEGFFSS